MDIVSICLLRAGSLVWQPRAGAWALTVICKATFVLAPTESPLAEDQDDLDEGDSYWDDDETRSLFSTSDLVPFKPRADVLLVGNAYAPHQRPTTSLVARLVVGDVDKSIEVFGDRAWAQDGSLREGRQFVKMPLRYERAAGGPGTSNPVGVPAGAAADRYGMVLLPNLQSPTVQLTSRHDHLEPIGFGPIAPGWPTRLAKLHHHGAGWSHREWSRQPLPENIDGGYFNAAPPDQQAEGLRANERIILENLHPQHARLVTSLPGVRPRAAIERRGDVPEQEIPLRCDTLSIDTDRGRCSVTWRGQFALDQPFAAGRVVVSIANANANAGAAPREPAQAPNQRAVGRSGPPAGLAQPPSNRSEHTLVDVSSLGLGGALPFVRSAEGPPADTRLDEAPRRRDTKTIQHTLPPRRAEGGSALPFNALMGLPAQPARAQTPAWPPAAMGETPKPPAWPAPVLATPALPAAVMPPARVREAMSNEPVAPQGSSSPWASSDPIASPSLGQFALSQSAEAPAAAAAPPASSEQVLAAPPAPRATPRAYIDLLWFDKDAPRQVRAQTPWLEALREPARDGAWMTADEAFEPKQEANDRRDVIRALSRVPAVDGEGVMAQMAAAIDDDGVLTRPLVVVRGELQLFFEEMETLKATIAVVSPLVGADKKLKELADAANETVSSDWRCTSAVAEGMTARLKEAFAQANRALPATYVDTNVERILLEQRRYQKRTILGSARLRAALVPAGASPGAAIPTYLPGHLEKELPMFQRFQVAIIAEAHSQQDQFESHAAALVVLALGRVLPVPGRSARSG